MFVSAPSSPIAYLFPDERHHSDAREHVLPGQALAWNAVRKRLGAVGPRLAEVTHEQGHVGPANMQVEGKDCKNAQMSFKLVRGMFLK